MKKALAIQIEFDIASVRRALLLITGEVVSDEEITAKYIERENVKVNMEEILGEREAFQMCAAMLAILMCDGEKKRAD